MGKPYSMSRAKQLDIQRVKCSEKNNRKKCHRKMWSQNLLSQFSIENQLVTCFTDDSFFQNVISNRTLDTKQKCVCKIATGTFLKIKKGMENAIDKLGGLKCIEVKSSPIPASSQNSPSKGVTTTEMSLPSTHPFSVDSLPDRASKEVDVQVDRHSKGGSIQACEKVSENHSDQHILSSTIVKPLWLTGRDYPVCQTHPGSSKFSGNCSSGKLQKDMDTVAFPIKAQKGAHESTKTGSCSSVQRRVIVTSFQSIPEMADSNLYSTMIDSGYISNGTMNGELNSSIATVHPMKRRKFDGFQISQDYPPDSTESVQTKGVVEETENAPTISIETFHFELEKLAVVSVDKDSLNVNCLEDSSRLIEEPSFPSDWQVVANQEFTMVPTINQCSLEKRGSKLLNCPVQNTCRSANSSRKLKDDASGNSYWSRTIRIKGTRSEGTFVPNKSNGVRFVSQMMVVLERNATADQMALNNLRSRGCLKDSKKPFNASKVIDSDTFLCQRCDVNFTDFQTLICHIDGHKEENLYICYYCQKQFPSNFNTVRHMRSHTGEKPFTCPVCSKSFSRPENMKIHRNIHNDVRKNFCEIHGKIAPRIDNLVPHFVTSSPRKFHQCEVCGITFSSKTQLDFHALKHSESSSFDLDLNQRDRFDEAATQMPNPFQQQDKHQQHAELSFHLGTFECDWCSKGFNSSRGLKIHSKLVHNKGPCFKSLIQAEGV